MKKLLSVSAAALLSAVACAQSFGALSINAIKTDYTQNFDSLAAKAGPPAVAAATTIVGLDAGGWKFQNSGTPTFAGGTQTVIAANGSYTAGGAYNYGGTAVANTDHAIGFLGSGSYGPASLMLQMANNTGVTLKGMTFDWDIERFRSGSRAFNISFFTSTDGTNWTSVAAGDSAFAAGANNTTYSVGGATVDTKHVVIQGLNIASGASFYLRWAYAGVGGLTNGQGLAIDNFKVNAVPEPTSMLLASIAGVSGGYGAWRRRKAKKA